MRIILGKVTHMTNNNFRDTYISHTTNILIEDHVWFAANGTILKSVTIKNNCIVGTVVIITKAFEQKNAIIAGRVK